MLFKITLPIFFSVYLICSPALSASSPLNTEQVEKLFDSLVPTYEKNKENLTPEILGQMELRLKPIIENQNSSHDILANTAYLLFVLDCKQSYQKAMDTLFYRPDFNAPLYKALLKRINTLKDARKKEEEQRRPLRFEKQQRPPHVDPHAEVAVPQQVSVKTRGKKKPKKPKMEGSSIKKIYSPTHSCLFKLI
jgi:thioredoxin-like negative regulator of GroEL